MALATLAVTVVVPLGPIATRLPRVSCGTAWIVHVLRFVAWTSQLARWIVPALARLCDGHPATDSESKHGGHEDLCNE